MIPRLIRRLYFMPKKVFFFNDPRELPGLDPGEERDGGARGRLELEPTLHKATVRLFNFCGVLGSLLCEHTPLLYQRHVWRLERWR